MREDPHRIRVVLSDSGSRGCLLTLCRLRELPGAVPRRETQGERRGSIVSCPPREQHTNVGVIKSE